MNNVVAIRVGDRVTSSVDIRDYLVGQIHRGRGEDLLQRLDGESAIRQFVMHLAAGIPLGEEYGDIWNQVCDILMRLPCLAKSTNELEKLALELKMMLSLRSRGVVIKRGNLSVGGYDIFVLNNILRMRLYGHRVNRVIVFRLCGDAAKRIDDRETR